MSKQPESRPPRSADVQLPIVWEGVEDIVILMANQFLGQVEHDDIILTFGQLTPPVVLGTPEQQQAQARELAYIAVKPVARVVVTPQRLQDLIFVLQETVGNFKKSKEGGGDGG